MIFQDNLSEKEIIGKIQNGEINYFEIFVKKYSQILYHYARKKLPCDSDAEDVVQNSFIKIYKKIDKFDTSKSFYPFIFTVLKNEISDFYRKYQKKFELNENLKTRDYSNIEAKIDVDFLFSKIKPEYKNILDLYYLQGLSYNEIAGKIKKPINTVKTIIRRAKIEARSHYEQ